MRKFLFSAFLVFFTLLIHGQVTVKTIGGAGTPSADYATIKDAFAAVNNGFLTGSIEFQIIRSTSEGSYAPLNASGFGSASYTSITIYPTSAGLSINSTAASDYLIYLNGADNVNIDGRVNKTGSTADLVISNGTRNAIQLTAGASNNSFKYCTIKGSWVTSQYGGVVGIGNNWESGGGSNNNLFEYNNFTNGGVRPYNCFYSKGIQAKPNSGNIIRNNNFFDLMSESGSKTIHLDYYNSNWTIQNNSFYETVDISNSSLASYQFIYIYELGTGTDFVINNNFFGGTAPQCAGNKMTKPSSNAAQTYCVEVYTPVGSNTSIQGNTISNINWTNSGGYQFYGIMVEGAGNYNVGGVEGNVIGSATGTESIVFTAGAANAMFSGIYISSSGTVDVKNNKIGSIKTANSNSTSSTPIRAIEKTNSNGTVTISNNTVGSVSQAASIHVSSTATSSTQDAIGIYIWNGNTNTVTNNIISNIQNDGTGSWGTTTGIYLYGGSATISSNKISNLTSSNGSGYTDQNATVNGIAVSTTSTASISLVDNSILTLTNSKSDFSGYINGIYFSGGIPSSGQHSITGNFVKGILATGASSIWGNLTGLRITGGKTNIQNNVISVGETNTCKVYGIYEEGTANNDHSIYFNTVYVGGTLNSGSNNSYSMYSASSSNNRDFRNNILYNSRTNNAGAYAKHYSVYYNYSTNTGLTSDFNNFFISGTGGVLARFNSVDISSISTLQTNISQDAGSKNENPGFNNPVINDVVGYTISSALLLGSPIVGITTDYFSNSRNATTPTIGALEYAKYWTGTTNSDWASATNWSSNILPASSENIIFSRTAVNDLVLDQSRSVKSINFNGSSKKVILGSYNLTIEGAYETSNVSYFQTNGIGKLKSTIAAGGSFAFPIGVTLSVNNLPVPIYLPVTLQNKEAMSREYYVSVSTGVFTNGQTTGVAVSSTNPRIDMTWDIGNDFGSAATPGVDISISWDPTLTAQNYFTGGTGVLSAPTLFHHNGSFWDQLTGSPTYDLQAGTFTYAGYIGSFSPFVIAQAGGALPVSWLSFSGKQCKEGVELNWATATETNTKDFEVQYSTNGISWKTIGVMAAAGNSNSIMRYQFIDTYPAKGNQTIYYRIKQLDLDARFGYSKVITITYLDALPSIIIYPNPARNRIFVNASEEQEVRLINMNGLIIWKGNVSVGRNEIPVSTYTRGTYILQSKRGIQKIILQ